MDPVIDPTESWKSMASRLVEFQEPPMVERSSLPLHLQPQNRVLGKVRSYLNGVSPQPQVSSRSSIQSEDINVNQCVYIPVEFKI